MKGNLIAIRTLISIAVLGWCGHACDLMAQSSPKPNVLFIFIDDLRPELGCYGNRVVKSPHLDALAANGARFSKQFVTVPTCGASRASLLTGKLPRVNSAVKNEAIRALISPQQESARPESFIANLKRNGYYTVGIGKISHYPDGYLYESSEPKGNKLELPHSWNEMLFDAGKWENGWNAFFAYADGSSRENRKKQVKPYERADVDDNGYPDGLSASLAIRQLKALAAKDQPFFLGVGFFKPHLPFNAPKKYWDLYNESDIALTPSPGVPENVHPASLHGSEEFNQYALGEEKASLDAPVSEAYARKLRHGYYASVSYIDAQVGKVVSALKELGLEKNTIIVVWGDHGWHLGDDRVWGKHTLQDWALRSVLMVKTPGMQKGFTRDEIVSSIDIYPTLMELCGIRSPEDLDGKSFAPLLKNPRKSDWSNVAYSYYRKGISVRTDRYRFTRYFREQTPDTELFDHVKDPYENHNIAQAQPELVKQLTPLWDKGNTGVFK